jgi:5'/3'-nucleotidase SurE
MTTKLRALFTAALVTCASPAFALNIVLSNDDGLTSNLAALYLALKAAGHDVIVSVPCTGQSGRGAAIVMYSSTVILSDNDAQIDAEGGCHNGAAPTGAPAVGRFMKAGYTNGDFYYVHGTPVMATAYGLDVLAQERWSKNPDLVLSGPNEGQNVGLIVNSSGTIGNVQFAAGRGIPSIALSAGPDTIDNTTLADPDSAIVAGLALKLLEELEARTKRGQPLLPSGVALNVNFPTGATEGSQFAFSRIGTFQLYELTFRNAPPYGFAFGINDPGTATRWQTDDEAVVNATKVSVTAMQVSFDHAPIVQHWLKHHLRRLFR